MLAKETMGLKERLILFRIGFLNWFIYKITWGMLGDIHLAVNYEHYLRLRGFPVY